ncbi:MAG: CopG family transcriptional regulator [Acidobacteriota bacterium]|nr:CopG family transcriptional regulator [Acidobacteriota bacterium]
MRTTLDLELDVLQAAKEIGAARGISAGQVVSELVRKALASTTTAKVRNGVPLLGRKAGSPPLTMAAVNRLRDE